MRMRSGLSIMRIGSFSTFSFTGSLGLSPLSLLHLDCLAPKSRISNCTYGLLIINHIIDYHLWNVFSNIIHKGQSFQQRDIVQKLLVRLVVVPILDRHPVLWLEVIGIGGIVQNYYVFEVSPESAHVFNEYSIVKSAMFSVELRAAVIIGVELDHERLSVF